MKTKRLILYQPVIYRQNSNFMTGKYCQCLLSKIPCQLKRIIIYRGLEELIHFENLKAHDYVSNTAIGSVGYKIYNSSNIETADSLLLTVKLNHNFASKLDID